MAHGGPAADSKRRSWVLDKLRAFLDACRGRDHAAAATSKTGANQNQAQHGRGQGKLATAVARQQKCLHLAGLDAIMAKIQKTEAEVNNFDGPHFTSKYRLISEACTQHALTLDGFDCAGMENVRTERKRMYIKLQEIEGRLKGKTHEDGQPCAACELKKL